MTAYDDTVLALNPVVYLKFDETSGTTASDSSGNGNDGTYNGGVTLGAAGPAERNGVAAQFDGIDDYVSVPLDLSHTDEATVVMWLYWDAFADDNRTLLDWDGASRSAFYINPNSNSGSWGGSSFGVGHTSGGSGTGGYVLQKYPRPAAATWLLLLVRFNCHDFDNPFPSPRPNGSTSMFVGCGEQTRTTSQDSDSDSTTDQWMNDTLRLMHPGDSAADNWFFTTKDWGKGRLAGFAVYDYELTEGENATFCGGGIWAWSQGLKGWGSACL